MNDSVGFPVCIEPGCNARIELVRGRGRGRRSPRCPECRRARRLKLRRASNKRSQARRLKLKRASNKRSQDRARAAARAQGGKVAAARIAEANTGLVTLIATLYRSYGGHAVPVTPYFAKHGRLPPVAAP